MVTSFRQLQEDLTYFGPRSEDTIVIHCGIVDCSPRPIPEWMRRVLGRAPRWLQEGVVKTIHRNRAWLTTEGRGFRAVEPAEFQARLRQMTLLAAESAGLVLLMGIAPPNDSLLDRSPAIGAAISAYNQLIEDCAAGSPANVGFVDVNDLVSADPDTLLTSDGHHLSTEGHAVVARAAIALLGRLAMDFPDGRLDPP